MIETVIVEAIERVPTLSDRVFPLNAPEKQLPPYCVYVSYGATETDTLGGWIGSYDGEIEVNIIHKSYKGMKALSKQVVDQLKMITEASLSIREDSPEIYESEIQAYRKIINIKMMY